jgi:hypothetical protein
MTDSNHVMIVSCTHPGSDRTTAAMMADQRGAGVLRRIRRARMRGSDVPLVGPTDPVAE